MSYKIGSFNVCNMGKNTNRKDWDIIANIILMEQFDIIALQEVLCEGRTVRSQLLPRLTNWEMEWGKPNKYDTEDNGDDSDTEAEDKRGEGYAFLWNAKRFQKVRTKLSDTDTRIAEPRILNSAGNDVDITGGFFRSPYYARFEPCMIGAKPFIELRLVNAHLFYGSSNSTDVCKRKEEFRILTEEVLPGLDDRRYGNSKVAYTIVMGDYNLNLDRPWNRYKYSPILSKEEEIKKLKEGKRERTIKTDQEGITTLKRDHDSLGINKGADYKKSYHFKNNYDHFSYDAEKFSTHQVSVKCGKVNAIQKYCTKVQGQGNIYDYYRNNVSDHLPIMLEIDLEGNM